MNNPDQELQIDSPLPLPIPPQDTEPEVVQPVAEEGNNKVTPKAKPRTNTYKKTPITPKRQPPQVSGVFLSEEDRRMLKKMNQIMVNRLGIKKNNSFKI